MAKFRNTLKALAALFPFAMAGGASASTIDNQYGVERDWAEALQQDTLAGYTEFVLQHPDAAQADVAHERMLKVNSSPNTVNIARLESRIEKDQYGQANSPEMIAQFIMIA